MPTWPCRSPTTATSCRQGASCCRGRRAICCTIRGSEMPILVARASRRRPMPAPDMSSHALQTHDAGPQSLSELEARLARDLELLLVPPAKQWLEPREHPQWGPMLDVAIIGAGMGGLSAAFALKRLGVRNM